MKKITLLTLASIAILFSSCLKEGKDCCIVAFEPYIGYSIQDGVIMYGYVSSAKVGTDSISVVSTRDDSKLVMHIKYTGKGSYILTGNQARYTLNSGSGAVAATYKVSPTDTSKVLVTQLDSVNKLIVGTFKLKLKKISGTTPGIYPDSIVFTKGQFGIALPR